MSGLKVLKPNQNLAVNPGKSSTKGRGGRRRALGDITNNKDGGSGGSGRLREKSQPSSVQRKAAKEAVTKAVEEFDLDEFLEDVDEIELVHGTSKREAVDMGLNVQQVKKAVKSLAKSTANDCDEEFKLNLFGDPELDGRE